MSRKSSKQEKSQSLSSPSSDPMTACVELCQQNRWREALVICRETSNNAKADGNTELISGLAAAAVKIEKNVRREMVGSVINAAREMLAKEYLLDVGE